MSVMFFVGQARGLRRPYRPPISLGRPGAGPRRTSRRNTERVRTRYGTAGKALGGRDTFPFAASSIEML